MRDEFRGIATGPCRQNRPEYGAPDTLRASTYSSAMHSFHAASKPATYAARWHGAGVAARRARDRRLRRAAADIAGILSVCRSSAQALIWHTHHYRFTAAAAMLAAFGTQRTM